ncbi:MAG: carboxypeptidase-like regulatory domain-containing protein [Candidatus Poribacteria bacterium]|nr:carboxypeptidase-like regulatory domain-containing protein [Candidatus Poribacteria bacterium]
MARFIFMLILAACVSMFTDIVFAQGAAMSGGTLRGQITDVTPAQNPIEDVEVKIVAQDSGKEWTIKTDADGNYKHAELPAGRYLISISKDGYDKRVGKSVTIVDGGDHFVPLKMAEKGKVNLFEVQPGKIDRMVIKQRIKQQTKSLLQGVAESMGERYKLDEAVVKSLYQSMVNSIEGLLAQIGGLSTFANASIAFKMLLAQPDCKAAFAEHLSEAQLQDYLDFTAARQQRDREAVARRITAALDRELSLTADQREKVVKLLRGAAWRNSGFASSMNTLRISSQKAVHLVHHRLKISLDNTLSEAQSKVWHALVNTNANREHLAVLMPEVEVQVGIADKKVDAGKIVDRNKKRPFIRKEAAKPVKIENEVKVVINEVAIDPPERLQPWIEFNAGTAASQEQMMEIAEAKLTAHTELLGSLDERATRRLALAAKGVAQQYIEAQDETPEAREELWGDGSTNVDITDHPMYQRAIKDVLSEEAFAQYSASQAEREVWHQQVLRDVIVACIDTQLLLDDTQRETLETAASQLVPSPLKEKKSAEFMFFQLFPQTVNFEILTHWQQDEFKRVFGPMMWRR